MFERFKSGKLDRNQVERIMKWLQANDAFFSEETMAGIKSRLIIARQMLEQIPDLLREERMPEARFDLTKMRDYVLNGFGESLKTGKIDAWPVMESRWENGTKLRVDLGIIRMFEDVEFYTLVLAREFEDGSVEYRLNGEWKRVSFDELIPQYPELA